MSGFLLSLALAQAAAATASPPLDAPRSWREQLFVSPAGEPFRVPEGQPYPVANWFAQADTDRDGRLTEAEFTADFQRFAAKLDTNQDSVIDGVELEAYEANIVPEVQSGAMLFYGKEVDSYDDNGDKKAIPIGTAHSAPMGAGKFGLINLPQPVAAMDVDLSGRITKREFAAAAAYRFSLLDPDGQGVLTLATLPHSFAQDNSGKVRKKRRR